MTSKIRSSADSDRLIAALAPADEAFRASEAKWGVARLERLVSSATLASYRRGWVRYREAIDTGDAAAVEEIAPKMVAALAFMDAEATAAGHAPLSVERWEAPMEDGRVLVVVRSLAEAHAIARDKTETRDCVVWSLAELARVLPTLEAVQAVKIAFPGAEAVRVKSGVVTTEGQVADWVRDDPIYEVIHA